MQVSVRELKDHLSQLLERARSGEEILVTSHKKLVARITGVQRVEDKTIQRLLESGLATWNGGKPRGASIRLSGEGKTLAEMVIEDRG